MFGERISAASSAREVSDPQMRVSRKTAVSIREETMKPVKMPNHEGGEALGVTDLKIAGAKSRGKTLPGVGNEEGQSLIEFAFVAPLLLVLATGIAAFGIVLNNYQALTNATNVSAQVLSASRGQTSDPCATTAQAFYAAAPTLHQGNLSFTIALNGTSVGGTTCTTATLVENQTAQVTVTYPCNFPLIYGMGFSCSLKAQTAEAIQ
jgi:TadE-like protein